MGLDMYLYKAKRIDGATMNEINNINNYLDYLKDKEDGSTKNYSAKEWNGCKVDELDMELVEKYKPEFRERFYSWDKEKEYGHYSIIEMVCDWRKANAIHKWFVENVQDGADDCGIYEVTRHDIQTLLNLCIKVKESSKLVKGKIKNGQTFKDGEWVDIFEDGEYIEDSTVANELLPCRSGFFFGSTEYDQWYMENINYTIEVLQKVLDTTDFNNEAIGYHASW